MNKEESTRDVIVQCPHRLTDGKNQSRDRTVVGGGVFGLLFSRAFAASHSSLCRRRLSAVGENHLLAYVSFMKYNCQRQV
jgi:hypothetical protein